MTDEWQARIEAIRQRMAHCDLCAHRCGADRTNGQTGICGATCLPSVYQHFIHLGEEIQLVPAFVVNFAGCNLHCPDCAERHRWTQNPLKIGSAPHYARAMAAYWNKSGLPKSLEWIGGEPSIHLDYVLEASIELKNGLGSNCPDIYLNTNVYFNDDLISYMKNILDGFVFDLKCIKPCELILTGFDNYTNVVTRNIQKIYEIWPHDKLILRHLIQPGHVQCCTKNVVLWCKNNTPDLRFNLMTAFHGNHGQTLSDDEKKTGMDILKQSGLKHFLIDGNEVLGN